MRLGVFALNAAKLKPNLANRAAVPLGRSPVSCKQGWIASYAKVIVTYSISLLAFLFLQEHHQFRHLSSLRNFFKLYWFGGSVVSALAISSSPAPVDAYLFLVSAAFVPLAVSFSSHYPS